MDEPTIANVSAQAEREVETREGLKGYRIGPMVMLRLETTYLKID